GEWNTNPLVWVYDVGSATACPPGPSMSTVTGCAFRNSGLVSRGKVVSAAPNLVWLGTLPKLIRLLNEPSTVRKPCGDRTLPTRLMRSSPAALRAAILLWWRRKL